MNVNAADCAQLALKDDFKIVLVIYIQNLFNFRLAQTNSKAIANYVLISLILFVSDRLEITSKFSNFQHMEFKYF